MGRAKALKMNMLSGWLSELVTLITGLILPRLILVTFGSSYNGMIGAITQFMGFTTILRAGIGSVTRAALFKPLAEGDNEKVSAIIAATDIFMKKIALVVAAYIMIFAVIFPFITESEYSFMQTFTMVLIMGATVFTENFFAVKYRILLQADQKFYIQTFTSIVARILCFIVAVILIKLSFSMHMVKLSTVITALSGPLILYMYVKKRYVIIKSVKPDNSAIKQRWDAFTQQMAVVVNGNIDLVLLSMFVHLREVSVYTVHAMVTHNIEKLITSMVNGINATFGNMIANNENENLKKSFRFIEWGLFASCAVVFSVTAIMITPFIRIYTSSVTDVNYIRPAFAYAMTMVAMMNCMRIPYQMLVEAAGHFKQTRNASILEVVVNIVVSIIMLYFYGIVGVIIGTFVAALIRTAQYAIHAYKHILKLPTWNLIKSYVLYFALFVGIYILFGKVSAIKMENFFVWTEYAVVVMVSAIIIVGVISLIFNKEQLIYLKNRFVKKRQKVKK